MIFAFCFNIIIVKMVTNFPKETFDEARKYPLFEVLRGSMSYTFSCVNETTAKQEILTDEERRLCEIRPFQGILKLVEKQEHKEDQIYRDKISELIGIGNFNLKLLDALKNPEVNDFRWRMKEVSEDAVKIRNKQDWLDKVLYQYPVYLESSPMPQKAFIDRLHTYNGKLYLNIYFPDDSITASSAAVNYLVFVKFVISYDATVDTLLEKILTKKATRLNKEKEPNSKYLLKVKGREEFLLKNRPLCEYQYIRKTVLSQNIPVLILFRSSCVELVETHGKYESMMTLSKTKRASSSFGTTTLLKKNSISAWKINSNFGLTVHRLRKLNVAENTKIVIKAGLFCGEKSISQQLETREASTVDGECIWDQPLKFDLLVSQLPRMARLSLTICTKVQKSKKKKAILTRHSWVNTTAFDFKSVLKTGPMTFYLWPFVGDPMEQDSFNPLGTVTSNPDIENAAELMLTFKQYDEKKTVCYPTFDMAELIQDPNQSAASHPSKSHLDQIRQLCEKDPLHQMHDQEMDLMWLLRNDCKNIPHALPKLLRSVNWCNQSNAKEV